MPNLFSLALVWIYIAVFYASRIFTNVSTVGGDGVRSVRYIETARDSNYFFPLWDPYVIGGRPSLADPEWIFHRLLAPVFSLAPDSYYNLTFNLILFFLLLSFATSLFFLAIRIEKINQFYAAVVSALLTCSGVVWTSVETGRLNALVAITTIVALLPLYKQWQENGNPWIFCVIVLFTATSLVVSGTYIMVGYIFFAAYVIGRNYYGREKLLIGLFRAVKHLGLFSALGLCLSALIMLPLMEFQLESALATSSWGRRYALLAPSSLLHIFIPYFSLYQPESKMLPYVSFLLIPGLILFAFLKVRFTAELRLVFLVGLIYLGLAVGFGISRTTFDSIYASIPLVNLIRWGKVYSQYAYIALGIVSAVGLSCGIRSELRKWTLGTVTVLVFLMVVVASYQIFIPDADNNTGELHALIILSIFLFTTVWLLMSNMDTRKGLVFLTLVGMTTHLTTPKEVFFAISPQREIPRRTNAPHWPELVNYYNQEYPAVRQYCLTQMFCPMNGSSGIPATVGFSLYFPEQSRNMVELVTRKPTDVQRSHWIKKIPCNELDPTGLEMTSTRYLFCKGGNIPADNHWINRGSSHNNGRRNTKFPHSIWENTNITLPFKLFYKTINMPAVFDADQVKLLWSSDVIALEEKYESIAQNYVSSTKDNIELVHWDEDLVQLKSYTDGPAVLFISSAFNNGWKASVNTNATDILRAYGTFQAIKLSAGANLISLQYTSDTWNIGKIISTITLLGLLVYSLFCSLRLKRVRKPAV